MIENGLSDVMNLIKRQRWERLFRRRELIHIDACKEFYANLTLYHYKKKEVARSRVRGVRIEFDSMRLASILGSGEHRRRDDEIDAPTANEEVNEEEQNPEFDWEVVVNEAVLQGESGSDDQFYDAQVEVEKPAVEAPAIAVVPASPGDLTNVQKAPATAGVDPSIPTGSIPLWFSNFKQNLNKLEQEDFKLIWRKLKMRMQDFLPYSNKPNHSPNHRIKPHFFRISLASP
ncbi:hypothetical protein Dimus_007542 [Dionaea muscipula]